MPAQKRFKAINFDLDTKKLKSTFGEHRYRQGYTQIQRFLTKRGFLHHQYSGYISQNPMSYGEMYILITDILIAEHPWLTECANKFDATNVTSQSNMIEAIKSKSYTTETVSPDAEGDEEIVL